MFNRLVKYFLENRLVTFIVLIAFIISGLVTMPFDLKTGILPRSQVPVDAIPDIGENQQIVATEWMGRSPKDVQDQITYPLTTALTGIPGVKTIRSTSMFGMSFIYIIFNDNVDFYWSRSRILEKLNSLPPGTLPEGVQPALGPDATALGQIFWYTLEGRNPETGEPTGGWDPSELRTIQDFYVKYALSTAEGVAEVSSAGGFVKEYQIDLDPSALKAYNVSVMDVMNAVNKSNLDIGAETIEINRVEYIIRGLGYIKSLKDLEESVIILRNNKPVRIKDVAHVSFGPATRRGGLDKGGAEAVGAVVVARYGSNPLEVINNVKNKIKEIETGLPQKTLSDGTISRVTIVPFYDRTGLIKETIGTLETALSHEILISIIVIIVLVLNMRASLIVGGLLPIGVLMTFIFMRMFGIDANIVALSGIVIAIGVMVDIGIVDVENILRHLEMPENRGKRGENLLKMIYHATTEVRAAVVTSIAITIVSFLPVFALQAQEGKLFHPLAWTKTFAMISAFILGIVVLPTMAHIFFNIQNNRKSIDRIWNAILIISGIFITIRWNMIPALALTIAGVNNLTENKWPSRLRNIPGYINTAIVVLFAVWFLAAEWLPLGAHNSELVNFLFVASIIAVILLAVISVIRFYEKILRFALENKWKFLIIPAITLFLGLLIWQGTDKIFNFVPAVAEKAGIKNFRQTAFWQKAVKLFPGMGKEFMPSLNEGSFLLMPTSMPHSGVEQNLEYVKLLDKRLSSIPEVDMAVGKWGRVNSAIDPAPIQMFENLINYRPEYILDERGHRMRFRTQKDGSFILKDGSLYNPSTDGFRLIPADSLIPDRKGDYFRQWRPHIRKPNDIWNEIVKVTDIPGLTSAPKLQPIETRLIMLSTGLRAPMGLKVYGPDLNSIEQAGMILEEALKQVPSIKPSTVFYDRAVGAPYLEIKLRREDLARYGMTVGDVQEVLQVAVGGMALTTSVEGRERFPVRVRYARELRDNPEDLKHILIPAMNGTQVPLEEIADVEYARGAQMIKSENTFPVGYIIFDKQEGKAEVDVVEEAAEILRDKTISGEIRLPAGVTWAFTGNYEHQVRAARRLAIVIPLSLIVILLLLYFQFRTVTASLIHFSGVFIAFSGGFLILWLYGQQWFMNFTVAGLNLRDIFQMHPLNLSVAVWVGFIALFGIATNDGVIMGTYIHQVFEEKHPATVNEVRNAVLTAGRKRVRPAMMTTAVTVIALLPVLSSTGKGAEIMVPMAIPVFGGMIIQVMTIFMVPLFQAMWRESVVSRNKNKNIQNVKNGNDENNSI
ncbi:MAG: efflux RND transporter permease subunit [Bacteroidales bacterium]